MKHILKGFLMYRILAQHNEFMVINKGPGLGMHDETDESGLVNPGLVSRVKADTGSVLYPVHRLDKMTSGLCCWRAPRRRTGRSAWRLRIGR
jgi:23S rRNA-/tRNA-specific pseudouridylate synthase